MKRRKDVLEKRTNGRLVGWYIGSGRNASVAYWNGQTWLTIGNKSNMYVIKNEQDCFTPKEFLCKTKIEPVVDLREEERIGYGDLGYGGY